jgi:hypothetical protein
MFRGGTVGGEAGGDPAAVMLRVVRATRCERREWSMMTVGTKAWPESSIDVSHIRL